jgi:type II secretory pathway pseudopilin PulG
MTLSRVRSGPPTEAGFVLIEIITSAAVLAIVAGAVLTLLQATGRTAADQRRHSEAYSLAQEDQARLRSMRLSALNRLEQSTPVTLDGSKFTVESRGVFVDNTAQADSSCTAGGTSADFVRVTSTVKWEGMGSRPPVTIQSIVAPSTGSLDPSRGVLMVTAKNAAGLPLAGLGLKGSGAGTFSGSTDATGCAHFADLPAGSYTVTTSGTGLVEKNGNAPGANHPENITAGGSSTLALEYDYAATLPVQFQYRVGSTSTFKAAKLDSVYPFNTGMQPARPYWTPSKTRELSLLATPIFPFGSEVSFWGGACYANKPGAGPGEGVVTLEPGKTAVNKTVQVPALEITAKKSGTASSGIAITVEDDTCVIEGKQYVRSYVSEAQGHQSNSASSTEPEYGVPYSTSYDICAYTNISGTNRRATASDIPVTSLTSTASISLNITGSSSSGTCPV